MTIANETELRGMEEVGRIVGRTLNALVPRIKAGTTTAELDAVAEGLLGEHGARSAPRLVYGFPATICISVNEEVVHGIPGERVLRGGDIVTVDVTAEKDGFMADAARTVVVPLASKLKRRLSACARVAFSEAMKVARPGRRVREIGGAIEGVARRQGFRAIRDLAGHGIGRTIHEAPSVPCVYEAGQTETLTPGMVLAVEPMISAGADVTRTERDGWTISTVDGSLSSHYENTILITRGAPRILTR